MTPAAISRLHTTRKIPRTLSLKVVLPLARISHNDFLPLDPIPEVPSWIPDRLIRLRVTFFIRRAYSQRITPWRLSSPHRIPRAKGVRAMVLSEFCRHPALSQVIRNFHPVHAAKPAESDAA